MTLLYPTWCYKEVCYKGTALYNNFQEVCNQPCMHVSRMPCVLCAEMVECTFVLIIEF